MPLAGQTAKQALDLLGVQDGQTLLMTDAVPAEHAVEAHRRADAGVPGKLVLTF